MAAITRALHPWSITSITLMAWVGLALVPSAVAAQVLPAGPVRAFDGRVTIAGEVTGTIGARDDEAFFNYTDYEHNAFRLFRLALAGSWRPAEWVALLGEVRSEDFDGVTPFAAYVRVRPWSARRVDIQAGRIPPTFGAYGRRAYGIDTPFIGYPLAYQYLTSLRADAVPGNADDLLRMRARGWRSSFPIGEPEADAGLPLVSALRWDTGVQVRWGVKALELSAALTNGTLSNPRVRDDNGGKQLAARAAATPIVGLVLGASAARGEWLSSSVPGGDCGGACDQTSTGLDVEYSRDHWLVLGEAVWTRWELPFPAATSNGRDVRAWAAWAEGRYRVTPRVYVAARVDHLGFSTLRPFSGSPGIAWDAPVDRLEFAAGYYLQRNVVARLAIQANWREAGRTRTRVFTAAQIGWWF